MMEEGPRREVRNTDLRSTSCPPPFRPNLEYEEGRHEMLLEQLCKGWDGHLQRKRERGCSSKLVSALDENRIKSSRRGRIWQVRMGVRHTSNLLSPYLSCAARAFCSLPCPVILAYVSHVS